MHTPIPNLPATVGRRFGLRTALLPASLFAFAFATSARAADATWNVNAAGSWVTDASWNPAAAPGSTSGTTNTDTATFGTVISAARVVTVDTDRNIFGINFAGNSSAYTLSGGNLLLTSGGTLQTSGGGSTHTDIVSAPITLEGDYTFATNSTTAGRILSIATTVTSGLTTGTTTLALDGTGTSANNAITGIISNGTGSNKVAITKSGAGFWTLSGANTFTGDVTLNAGTLRGTNTATTDVLAAFGTGGINLSGGTLQLRANGSGNGGKTIVAGNNVTMGSAAATVDVNNNSGNSSNNITFGNLSVGTGQLNVTGGNSYSLRFSGTTTLTGDATFNPTTAGLTLVGAIGDGGNNFGITKIGTGTLTLAGASTYAGSTSVLAGTLSLAGNAPAGSAGTLGNATSAVLLGDTSGSASTTLVESGTNTIARDIVVQAGNTGTTSIGSTAQGNGFSTYSGNITLGSSATGHGLTLTGNSFHTTSFTGVIQDPAGLSNAAGVLTIAAGVSSGSIALGGANTFTGGIVLNSGNLKITNLQGLGMGTLTINGGAISQSASGAVTGLTGQTWAANFAFSATSGAINLGTAPISLVGARAITIDNGGVTLGGVVSGSGSSLRVSSTNFSSSLNLTSANTFDGGLTISQGGTASITVISNNASALGTGQVRLSNSANSRLNVSVDTTVDSLTSGVNAITTISGGTGGTNGTYDLVFTGGGGSGAVGTATISGGAITAVSITELGKDYTSAPTITLSGGGGTGTVTSVFGSSSVNLKPSTTAQTLTIAGTNASPATFGGIISGAGGNLVKAGSGTQMLSGTNTYTGATTVTGGILGLSSTGSISNSSALTVNGGNFRNNSSTDYTGTFSFTTGKISGTNWNGSLSGLTIGTGQTISPGNSPGTAITGSQTWAGGGTYEFEVNNFTGTAGSDPGWDLLSTTGNLAITATSGSTFTIKLVSLGLDNLAGEAVNFANTSSYSLQLTSVAGSLSGFAANAFTVDASAFANAINGGTWSVSNVGNDLFLNFTAAAVPEPSTYAAILGALALAGVACRRRRERSV